MNPQIPETITPTATIPDTGVAFSNNSPELIDSPSDALNVATFRKAAEIFSGLDISRCHYCEKSPEHEFPVCSSHRHCTQCNKLMMPEEINISVRNSTEPMHPSCGVQYANQFLNLQDKSTVTIPRVQFDYLNRLRLFMEVSPILTEQTNRDESIRQIHHIVHAHQLSHDDIYLMLTKLEAAAGALHTIIGKNKEKIRVSARDKQQVLASRATEESKAAAKTAKRVAKQQKQETKDKVSLAGMSQHDKARFTVIQTYLKMGLSEVEANEEADKFINKRNAATPSTQTNGTPASV